MGKETGIRYGYLSVCLLTAAICSCRGPVELGSSFSGPQSWDSQDGTGEMVRKTRYITGIEYPQGYNWMPDLGSNAEGAVLFLMKEDERVLEIPVGYGHCVSADADMHRCIDGHLYTDFSTDQETVVKKAEDVIEKSLATVQQIASLLGENAAETEIMLNSLIDAFSVHDEGGQGDGFTLDEDQLS